MVLSHLGLPGCGCRSGLPAQEAGLACVIVCSGSISLKGGAWGVRLRATAPSIHMMRADLMAELSPVVGSEQQARDLIQSLSAAGEEDREAVWESNLFGKTLYELVNDGLNAKLTGLPEEARMKLRKALERITNEGANGLICLVL